MSESICELKIHNVELLWDWTAGEAYLSFGRALGESLLATASAWLGTRKLILQNQAGNGLETRERGEKGIWSESHPGRLQTMQDSEHTVSTAGELTKGA